jgi:hypothetical protein
MKVLVYKRGSFGSVNRDGQKDRDTNRFGGGIFRAASQQSSLTRYTLLPHPGTQKPLCGLRDIPTEIDILPSSPWIENYKSVFAFLA